MGVRPPQQNDGDAPETVAFGIAALDEHLERAEVVFPMTAEGVLDAVGDPRIPYDSAGHEMRLSEALGDVDRGRFETRQEFMNALHPVFEARREQAGDSLVGRIRTLLPF